MMKRPFGCGDSVSSGGNSAMLNLKVPLPPSFQTLFLNVYRVAREERTVSSPSSPVSTVES